MERSPHHVMGVFWRTLEQLGADHLVDPGLGEADPTRHLQTAMIMAGVAEGQAIGHATQVMREGTEDALAAADDRGFRATRMIAHDQRTGELFWSLWTLRRLINRLQSVSRQSLDPDVESALVALRVVHALLSSAVYSGPEAELVRSDMHRQAESSARELSGRLRP